MKKKCRIIIPNHVTRLPDENELEAAKLFMKKYKQDVEFLEPHNGYKVSTPDFISAGQLWEIKTPETDRADRLIEALRDASKQAENIIINSKELRMTDAAALRVVQRFFLSSRSVKRIVFINKNHELSEFLKKRA
ncbi:hypothetical protein FWG76_02685 [Candidatus Saccharibacteria bacterium]|nr:hypothetical protein [Candidatus Saccharibacteria bacterium]